MTKLIEVTNSFGRLITLNREEFVARWTGHTHDLKYLADTAEDWAEIKAMQARLAELANAKFDALPAHST